jgi:hypothetical protein
MVQHEVDGNMAATEGVAAATDRVGCRGGVSDVDHSYNIMNPIVCKMVSFPARCRRLALCGSGLGWELAICCEHMHVLPHTGTTPTASPP